jgi:hypothetical protein
LAREFIFRLSNFSGFFLFVAMTALIIWSMLKGLFLPLNYINQVKDIVIRCECSTHGRDIKCFSWILRCDIPVVYQITVWKMNMKNRHKHNYIVPL